MTTKSPKEMPPREKDIIAKIARLAASSKQVGDDAALWKPTPGRQTVLTCDWFLEGTHFLLDKHPADAVGWKCLARAVSDIAAMGGTPRCFLMSLALPENLSGEWLSGFLIGLRRASKQFECALVGGDTTRRKDVLISLTIVGEIVPGKAVLRSGARVGDGIYVSGILGEAELGLRMLRQKRGKTKPSNEALRKHLYPTPRIKLGQWLSKARVASAMMDLSDGLSTDLPRLCEASGVGAEIFGDSLPVTSLAPRVEAKQLALHGGDDYELLFIASKKNQKRLLPTFEGLPLTRIGVITKARKISLISEKGKTSALHSGGWDPFRKL
ncbi:MAG TPA: thiamine-phosphate kinase [Candidatus Acidoferrum sp.]|nr:thiamine-phosphate kinase [Candidatus Acidoferrum sp.]